MGIETNMGKREKVVVGKLRKKNKVMGGVAKWAQAALKAGATKGGGGRRDWGEGGKKKTITKRARVEKAEFRTTPIKRGGGYQYRP